MGGYGVCVENGNDLLKAQADWLCPGPEEQGVAQRSRPTDLDSRA